MGYALEMRCPSCGEQAKQHVGPKKPLVKEIPWFYKSGGTTYFSHSRVRLRICKDCGEFPTEEMSSEYLYRLHRAVSSLVAETETLKSEVANLKAENKRLQRAVNLSNKHVSPLATPKRTKNSTRPPHL